MNNRITFILLISSFNYIYLSTENYKCKASDVNREIEIGDEVTLCIHSQKKGIKIAYKLKVDEYSIITMESGFDYLAKNESKAQLLRYHLSQRILSFSLL